MSEPQRPEALATADAIAVSLLAVWAHLCSVLPAGFAHERDGAMAGTTGVPVAMLNGVWVANRAAPAGVVAELLEEVAGTSLPFCLQLRPGCDPALLALGPSLGMHPHADLPMMALDTLDAVHQAIDAVGAPRLRALEPAEAPVHCALAAEGFGMPEDIMTAVVGPATLELPGILAYVAEVDGEPRSTALAITLGDHVGIFDVATPERYRRRGLGGAVTAVAVRDAFASGARRAFLQTSPLGQSTYERLGFTVIESWMRWASVPAAT
jgi:GNAT superfamily N-acetyltransferase